MIRIPRMMFAAPASGSGKTMITCAVLELLRRRKVSCVSFKCGPDYIDPMFHQYVLGIPGCNLDSFFLPPEQVADLFREKAGKADMAVIEGAMGYYDGVAGVTTHASAYEIARITDTPVVLIIDGKKSSLSLAATVKGFMEYEKDSHVCGVILNRTSTAMARRLQPCLESLGVRLYGAVPQCREAQWESRHLGLTLPEEQENLREKVRMLADRLEQCLDMDGLCELAESAPPADRKNTLSADEKNAPLADRENVLLTDGKIESLGKRPGSGVKHLRRIAVARDEAFCFYYQENLELLEREGWELVPFSPLHDRHLPCAGISAILLGGGYPEIYAGALSENKSMLEEIRRAKEQGIKILAECGGFLYLHETLEGADGIDYPMTGLIKARGYRTGKLSRFGYVMLYDQYGKPMMRAHEFHYWDSTLPGESWKAVKPLSDRNWECMHVTGQMAAGFPHLYYGSNPAWILEFLSL